MNVPIDSACAGTFIGLLKSASSLTTLATVLLMLWQLRVATRLATTKASAAQPPCTSPSPPPNRAPHVSAPARPPSPSATSSASSAPTARPTTPPPPPPPAWPGRAVATGLRRRSAAASGAPAQRPGRPWPCRSRLIGLRGDGPANFAGAAADFAGLRPTWATSADRRGGILKKYTTIQEVRSAHRWAGRGPIVAPFRSGKMPPRSK